MKGLHVNGEGITLQSVCLFFLLSAIPMIQGCSWNIVPPEGVQEPVTVYVSVYGRHTRLALPDGEGRYVEYGFGDWRFYAEAERNLLTAVRALFFSSGATLSRRELDRPEDVDLRRHFYSRRTEAIDVPAQLATRLHESLKTDWDRAAGEQLYQGPLAFRKTPMDYSLFNNSNHQTARWLEQLQCQIRGWPVWSDFRVVNEQP